MTLRWRIFLNKPFSKATPNLIQAWLSVAVLYENVASISTGKLFAAEKNRVRVLLPFPRAIMTF